MSQTMLSFVRQFFHYDSLKAVLLCILMILGTLPSLQAAQQCTTPYGTNVVVTVGPVNCGNGGVAPCWIKYVSTVADDTPGAQICYRVQVTGDGQFNIGCVASGQSVTTLISWGSSYCYSMAGVWTCTGLYTPNGTMWATKAGYTNSSTVSFPL